MDRPPPQRRCLDCGRLTRLGSRCESCRRAAKRYRNADRARARRIVADSPVCARCGATDDLTADHVVELADGGRHDGDRVTLCRSCNSKKGNRAR